MLKQIIHWAKHHPSILAVILTGSRAQKSGFDQLSDYDITVFVRSDRPFVQDSRWLSEIGKVWVCVPETIIHKNKKYPTRLVIFEKGVKVDFTFLPMRRDFSEFFRGDYKILFDKGGVEKRLKKSSQELVKQPSEQDFLRCIEEFWFEAYHVGVYLKRGDLWQAMSRDSDIKHRLLLQMMAWNYGAKTHWKNLKVPFGKRVDAWVDAKTWKSLFPLFAHFDGEDSWKALIKTSELFRQLANETAKLLDYTYPKALDKNISGYLSKLHG